MAQTIRTLPDYRTRLDAAVTALSLFIHDLRPEAQLEVSFVRYEDEDAHIWVSLPAHFTPEAREDLKQIRKIHHSRFERTQTTTADCCIFDRDQRHRKRLGRNADDPNCSLQLKSELLYQARIN